MTAVEGEGDEIENTNSSSFPLFPLSDLSKCPSKPASKGTDWLSNSSFNFDVSSLPTTVPSIHPDTDEDEPSPERPPTYDLIDSSLSDRDESRVDDKRRKRKKKRRKSTDSEGIGRYDISRKSKIQAWAGSETKQDKGYYIDSRGDYDNLTYGCLYRMAVPHYKLYPPSSSDWVYTQVLHQSKGSMSSLDAEYDLDVLLPKLREEGRYFSSKYSSLERHNDFKRLRVVPSNTCSAIPEEFIPFETREQCDGESVAELEIRESWDDEVLRRIKDFNKMSREFPHDEKVWIQFADFQDKIASRQKQKTARLQTLEKKISILEKAVEFNPDNEDLVLYLLKAYQSRDNIEVIMERWEKILKEHSGSCKLWKEFLLVCQGDFSRFKVIDVRKVYACAIRSLSAACSKLCRQVHPSEKSNLKDPALVQIELGLIEIFISLCRFEWQTGHREVATGLFQAEIEYSLFCPSLLLSEQSKQKLFEHFWSGSGARIGEDGALGWSSWLEKEEENRQKSFIENSSEEAEVGGWTGWYELSSRDPHKTEEPENDGMEGAEEFDDLNQEDDIESMMKKLGLDVNADAGCEVQDASTWRRWSEEESSRDFNQWMPVRSSAGADGDEHLSRVILFEDVNDYIFSLWSEDARFSLVIQFIDFFGGRDMSRWICTNSTSWAENILGLELVPTYVLEDLRRVHEVVLRKQNVTNNFILEFLLGCVNENSRRSPIMKFLRNAIMLCLNVFPRNYILEDALLIAEEICSTQMKTSAVSVTPCRALAKSLLKIDRQDLLLCGVYARREAAFGNIDIARKVFDMALSSSDGLPLDLQTNMPLLYFWYAEMELAACTSGNDTESGSLRAMHILCCLGSGVKYSSFNCIPSSMQLLRARQGFKEQIKKLRASWSCGDVKDSSIALICSAALFEELTTGWSSGLKIFEEAFTMALPERRSLSYQLESLFCYYEEMFQRHLKDSELSKAWSCFLQGLQIYPYNPRSFSGFIEVGCLYTVPNKIRLILDDCCRKKPSVIVWMFALSFELAKGGSVHRVHNLFERALANDRLQKSVVLWRCYLAYEVHIKCNLSSAKRIFFRAIHSCPWSKKLWLDGFQKLSTVLTAKELSDLQEVMADKELHLRTDIYEILLQDEVKT